MRQRESDGHRIDKESDSHKGDRESDGHKGDRESDSNKNDQQIMTDIKKITIEDVKSVFPERARDMHKGGAGRVLLIAGSPGMAGCAVLGAKAALRTGAGLVYVCTPKANQQVLNTGVPEAVWVDWTAATKHFSGEQGYRYDAVAFGPGTGTGTAARRMLKTLLLSYDGSIVIDADGLMILAEDKEIADLVRTYCGDVIITPHPGEAARLTAGRPTAGAEIALRSYVAVETESESRSDGSAPAESAQMSDRRQTVETLAKEYGTLSILKGQGTLVAVPRGDMILGEGTTDSEVMMNTTGNPGMATAGTGDVLTGVILSLCGQGNLSKDAAAAGVYVHGLAGDIAAEDKGEYGVIAGDIADKLPYAIKRIQGIPGAGSRKDNPGAGA